MHSLFFMVIQVTNIVSGFLLSEPMIKKVIQHEGIPELEAKLARYSGTIGVVELILGCVALVERVLGLYLVPVLGASYPQAIPAILMGLLLASHLFDSNPTMQGYIAKIRPYSGWVGLLGIAVGVGSLV